MVKLKMCTDYTGKMTLIIFCDIFGYLRKLLQMAYHVIYYWKKNGRYVRILLRVTI